MKPFAKICIIIAVIAAALGLVGIGAGMAMGASPDEFLNISFQESHRVLKHERADFVEVFGVTSPDKKEVKPSDIPEGLILGDENTQGLELELKAGEITFCVYDGEEIILAAENLDKVRRFFDIEVEKEGVSIEDTRDAYIDSWELQIYLPDRIFRDIDLDFGAADVNIEVLQADEISIDLGAGNLEAGKIVAGRSADLDVGAGEMTISWLEGTELDLDCGIGSLEISLQGKESDYSYTLDCGAGTIFLGENSYSGLGRGTRLDNSKEAGATKQVDADCGIGEMIITFEEE